MSTVQVEKVGGSVVITIDDGATIMLDIVDAMQLGTALLQVAALGADTLDFDRPGEEEI